MTTVPATRPKSPPFVAKSSGPKPEINVTPLVDVVLVLLIIFMVIAPQLEAGEQITLPSATHVASPKDIASVTVTLTSGGRVMVDRDVVDEHAMHDRLVAEHARAPEKPLVIKADRDVPYGKARSVFVSARDVGFSGVSLTVDEKAP